MLRARPKKDALARIFRCVGLQKGPVCKALKMHSASPPNTPSHQQGLRPNEEAQPRPTPLPRAPPQPPARRADCHAHHRSPHRQPRPLVRPSFLEGTWEAKTTDPSGPQTSGRYTFVRELDGHILARHATTDPGCKAPASFDCKHGDLLYLFGNAPGQPLQAIYFDNEGHTLHYDITTPTPTSVIFLSQPGPGPRFRLTYERKGPLMSGKFQMRMPGAGDWHSYLEWSGGEV